MLGKLVKYEFKNTSRMFGIIYIIMVLATIVGCISLGQLNTARENSMGMIVWAILLGLYVICIIVLSVLSFVYLCGHYHKTMYSDQGYLTHTLPVKTSTIFLSKLLVAFIWMIVTGLLCSISIFCMIWAGVGNELWSTLANIPWDEANTELYAVMGLHVSGFVILMIFSLLISTVFYLLFIYAAMAIGQLFGAYKTGASVLAAVVMYAVTQVISLIFAAGMGYNRLMTIVSNSDFETSVASQTQFREYMQSSIGFGQTLNIIFIIVLFVACIRINGKHLNLD